MNAFLGEVGSRLADRWLASVLTPGLLLLGAIGLATRLGQAHALDVSRITVAAHEVTAAASSRNPAVFALGAVVLLGTTVALGLLIRGLGLAVGSIWMTAHVALWWLVRVRRWRWSAAEARVAATREAAAQATGRARVGQPDRTQAALAALESARARRDAICLDQPERAFWAGDRMRVAGARVNGYYSLDLAGAWPRLWAIASEALRTDLEAAQSSYADAARLTAWGVLCLAVGCWWWPAAPVGLVAALAGDRRARSAVDVLADLLETTVDLHGGDLAQRLGLADSAGLSREAGAAISALIRRERDEHEPGV